MRGGRPARPARPAAAAAAARTTGKTEKPSRLKTPSVAELRGWSQAPEQSRRTPASRRPAPTPPPKRPTPSNRRVQLQDSPVRVPAARHSPVEEPQPQQVELYEEDKEEDEEEEELELVPSEPEVPSPKPAPPKAAAPQPAPPKAAVPQPAPPKVAVPQKAAVPQPAPPPKVPSPPPPQAAFPHPAPPPQAPPPDESDNGADEGDGSDDDGEDNDQGQGGERRDTILSRRDLDFWEDLEGELSEGDEEDENDGGQSDEFLEKEFVSSMCDQLFANLSQGTGQVTLHHISHHYGMGLDDVRTVVHMLGLPADIHALDRVHFRNFFLALHAHYAHIQEEKRGWRERLQSFFAAHETDGDGGLSAEDLLDAFASVGLSTDQGVARWIVDNAGMDGKMQTSRLLEIMLPTE